MNLLYLLLFLLLNLRIKKSETERYQAPFAKLCEPTMNQEDLFPERLQSSDACVVLFANNAIRDVARED